MKKRSFWTSNNFFKLLSLFLMFIYFVSTSYFPEPTFGKCVPPPDGGPCFSTLTPTPTPTGKCLCTCVPKGQPIESQYPIDDGEPCSSNKDCFIKQGALYTSLGSCATSTCEKAVAFSLFGSCN